MKEPMLYVEGNIRVMGAPDASDPDYAFVEGDFSLNDLSDEVRQAVMNEIMHVYLFQKGEWK